MTSNHTHHPKVGNNQVIQKRLQKINFKGHEISSGFRKREPRKITGKLLLVSFLMMAMKGSNSFQQWAWHIGYFSGTTVSRQGLWKRTNERFSCFLSMVLLDLLEQQVLELGRQFKRFGKTATSHRRILLQDSTTLSLPDWLANCYPGNFSRGKQKALLKLQVVYDIVGECFVHFEATPYSANDQSKAGDISLLAEKGDLVIRDLGYFVLKSFHEMSKEGVDFVSRLRYGLNIYTAGEESPLQLLKELRKKGRFDRIVIIGKEQKLKVRLVAVKVPERQAENRRRKAKKDRDKRLNHSKEYYELLGYDLYITNINTKTGTPNQLQALYALRWRIESVFKCWKSYFHLQRLVPKGCPLTKERVESIIYMFLIYILLFHTIFYNKLRQVLDKELIKQLSLAKLCQFTASHIEVFLFGDHVQLIQLIKYYCMYDKRKDRKNYAQCFA